MPERQKGTAKAKRSASMVSDIGAKPKSFCVKLKSALAGPGRAATD
jgi:hypothetical protein